MAASRWRKIRRHHDHSWARTRYSDYVDSELPHRQQRRMAGHQELCPECRRVIRTLRALLPSLNNLRFADRADPSLANSIADAVRADGTER